jgi:uncharacterized protein (DUF1697 family)
MRDVDAQHALEYRPGQCGEVTGLGNFGNGGYNPAAMTAIICMLRGVNVGGHNKIQMNALRDLCGALKLECAQTYVQSGNVVFLSREKNLSLLSSRIQDAIESKFRFRPDVVLRTAAELRKVIGKNPFAGRKDVEPAKLLVVFLSTAPAKAARDTLAKFDTRGEELHFAGSELYIYFRNGMGQTKLSWPGLEKTLNSSFTGRNWNTVTKLLEMAEALPRRTGGDPSLRSG